MLYPTIFLIFFKISLKRFKNGAIPLLNCGKLNTVPNDIVEICIIYKPCLNEFV